MIPVIVVPAVIPAAITICPTAGLIPAPSDCGVRTFPEMDPAATELESPLLIEKTSVPVSCGTATTKDVAVDELMIDVPGKIWLPTTTWPTTTDPKSVSETLIVVVPMLLEPLPAIVATAVAGASANVVVVLVTELFNAQLNAGTRVLPLDVVVSIMLVRNVGPSAMNWPVATIPEFISLFLMMRVLLVIVPTARAVWPPAISKKPGL